MWLVTVLNQNLVCSLPPPPPPQGGEERGWLVYSGGRLLSVAGPSAAATCQCPVEIDTLLLEWWHCSQRTRCLSASFSSFLSVRPCDWCSCFCCCCLNCTFSHIFQLYSTLLTSVFSCGSSFGAFLAAVILQFLIWIVCISHHAYTSTVI